MGRQAGIADGGREGGASRQQGLARVLAAIGTVNREFTARGSYPFQDRALGRSQLDLLFVLSQAGGTGTGSGTGTGTGLGVGGLAAALGVTSGAVTQLVDALRSEGLVTSEVNPADRRGRIIRLTADAAVEVDAFQREYAVALAPRFDALTSAEVVELERLLNKVQAAPDPAPASTARGAGPRVKKK
ncbi:DNA-binding MarR family transcriptional regulator [Cryobacterium sp. MP_M5]|uniref:MarR family winged helix-turn-helix transcriptional regulator n=1 Tax=unclassified Cryobacterium TaxID=2649013 RepID=UPI0018CB5FE9|nr:MULTISPECIES: MarR family winged helix-turn-helix transcriptional regulator [unclassified Cryobacterium]MBG6058921.1 DNA-binding MarR family transcriptional regulator [Cryobacterium sp. MP_M3]MEC5177070.1 DNA-binding MarR family transcriptional regulator [Cryobacterium sp. MP_M5]